MRDKDGILHLYVFGGLDYRSIDGNLYSYNTETHVWTYWPNNSGIPKPERQSAVMGAHGGYLYLWGGETLEGLAKEDVFKYNFE